MSAKRAVEYLFFYGHDKKKAGVKACFSNWYPAKFTDSNGHEFAYVCAAFLDSFSTVRTHPSAIASNI